MVYATVMMLSVTANAMVINEPLSVEFPIKNIATSTNYNDSTRSWYPTKNSFVAGSYYYDTGYTLNDNKIVDTYDGTTPYFHLTKAGYNGVVTLNSMKKWGKDIKSAANHVGSFGKTRMEVIFRLNDANSTSGFTQDGFFGVQMDFIKETDGSAQTMNMMQVYYVSPQNGDYTNFNLQPSTGGFVSETEGGMPLASNMPFGKWYRLTLDVDCQADRMEAVLEQFKDDQSGEVDSTLTQKHSYKFKDQYKMTCVGAATLRFRANQVSADIAQMKLTRDGVYVKDAIIDDTNVAEKLTASVKVASNVPANDYERQVLLPIANKYDTNKYMFWKYDYCTDDTLYTPKTTSPMLILAQYDAKGSLLGFDTKTVDLGTLSWGVNTKGTDASIAGFNYKDMEITVEKEENYSYAKAFVWNNLDACVPYENCISTVTE